MGEYKDRFGKVFDDIKDISGDMLGDVKDKTEDVIDEVKSKAGIVKDKVVEQKDKFESGYGELKDKAEAKRDVLKKKAGAVSENVKKIAEDFKEIDRDTSVTEPRKITLPEAKDIAKQLGIDFSQVAFSLEEYLEGLNIELEHGIIDPETNVTNDDPLVTGKIALAHLKEIPIYYNDDIGLEAWEHALETFQGDPKGKKIQIV